ncbi:MAG: hypothetical protein AAGC81_12990 [Pseudomonadota bacterium]
MSRVVQLAEFRFFQGPKRARPSPVIWHGLQVPDRIAASFTSFPRSNHGQHPLPVGLDCAAHVLRALTRRRDRFLFLDAGIGLLPALAARSGARRVIAFESDRTKVNAMAALFSQNRLGSEAIFGKLQRSVPLQDHMSIAAGVIPCFDRDLILDEEKIETLVLTAGVTDPTVLTHMPHHVRRVILTDGERTPPQAERDRLIVHLISEGFSYDPQRSERNALVFQRSS